MGHQNVQTKQPNIKMSFPLMHMIGNARYGQEDSAFGAAIG